MMSPFVMAALLLGANAIAQTPHHGKRLMRTASQATITDHKNHSYAIEQATATFNPDGSLIMESDSAGKEQESQRGLLSKRTGGCENGDVKVTNENEGAVNSVSKGSKYIPWVYSSGKWYPICGHYFWDDNNGATKVCQQLGFSSGKKDKKKSPAYSKDAMPVGECKSGESLTACTDGGNAWGNFGWRNNDCRKGKKVRCLVKCYGGGNQKSHSCASGGGSSSIIVRGQTLNKIHTGGYCGGVKMAVWKRSITAGSYDSAVGGAWSICKGASWRAGYVSVRTGSGSYQFKCYFKSYGPCSKVSSSQWNTWKLA